MSGLFVREEWTSFRHLATLSQKAGVPAEQLRRLVVKELVDNALDVAGTCSAGMTASGAYIVEDAGPGLAPAQVATLFSVKRPLASSKLVRLPTRGALGNGLRVVVGAVLASGGQLEVWTQDQHLRLHPQDTGDTLVTSEPADCPIGMRVQVVLGPAIPADADPLAWARAAIMLAAGGVGYRGKSSGWWYDDDSFYELLQAAGHRSVREVVEELDGCSGGKAGRIAAPFKGRPAAFLTREESVVLLAATRANSKPVTPDRLGGVGPLDGLPTCYTRETGTFTQQAGRGGVSAELPLVVEVGGERRDERTKDTITVCVNRTPITGTVHAWHDDQRRLDLVLFGCGLDTPITVGRATLRLWINVATPYMPITTDGKEPNLDPFATAIAAAIGQVARKLQRTMPKITTTASTQKGVILDNLQAAIAAASGEGQYRYSERQLFYAARPYILAAFGKEPTYDNFCKIIAEYEMASGRLAGMYRDARGTLYHPHLHQAIPLGTREVEQYQRPAWLFNKVLYIEKEGFFEVLRGEQWPERHDCALLTSKGFASGAARDLLDMLGTTGEPITFFCVHDADASGTLIYQSLQEGTRARPGRTVRIVNIGLEPWEAVALGLAVEPVQARKEHRPVAQYVIDHHPRWGDWLQHHRVELNAMSTPQFLTWLDAALAEHDTGKVLPAGAVLTDHVRMRAEEHLRDTLTARILIQADFEGAVALATPKLYRHLPPPTALAATVRTAFEDDPASPWTHPLDRTAADTVARLLETDEWSF